MAATGLVGCSREDHVDKGAVAPSDVYSLALVVNTIDGLPTCTSPLYGTTAFVKSPIGLYTCQSAVWVPIPCLTIGAGAVAYASASQTLLACVKGQWNLVALPSGSTGAVGPQGLPGAIGPSGAQGPAGPTGATGPQGTFGVPGAVSLVVQLPAPAIACPSGGTEVESGTDKNGDGQLQSQEITSVSYVCNGTAGGQGPVGASGTPGSQIQLAAEPAGPNCATGGERIDIGLPSDSGFVIQQTDYVCNGLPAAANDAGVSDTGTFPSDASTTVNCESSTFKVRAANATGVLDPVVYDTSVAGVVTDKTTGLTWEQNITAQVPGASGCGGGGGAGAICSQAQAIAYCNNLNLVGTGWRLPTLLELTTLLDFTRTSAPLIDVVAFPEPLPDYVFWTSSVTASSPGKPWVVTFFKGYTYVFDTTSAFQVRCVR